MHLVLTGGTGFIGQALCEELVRQGHRVTLLTRNIGRTSHFSEPLVSTVEWNGREPGSWEQSLDGADAVINLAGAPIAEARWTVARRRLLMESRVLTTRLLVEAIARRSSRPGILVSASGVGYYGASDDRVLDEGAPRGEGFLADLCLAWETEAIQAERFGTRVIVLRIGLVLERDGGALPKMLLPFRLGLGGPVGPGTQWVSWIHRRDLIGLIQWALADPGVSGPVNAVAPEAVTMAHFCKTLGQVLHRPSWLPVPAPILRIALGELGTLMTTGQRVSPTQALAGGYVYHYPTLQRALYAIFAKEQGDD